MATKKVDWNEAVKPLIKKYKGNKHPLEYKNTYQLLIMVILSAQDSDKHINAVAPPFFKAYPTLKSLTKAKADDLFPYIGKVRGFAKKADWITRIAQEIKDDKKIPLTMEALVELPGIGRKSANVIMREAGVKKAEGVMVDLHVVRVANRLGISKQEKGEKIEADIMSAVDEKNWGEAGMAMSFLGRETCRPTDPHHAECVMNKVCVYYASLHKGKKK